MRPIIFVLTADDLINQIDASIQNMIFTQVYHMKKSVAVENHVYGCQCALGFQKRQMIMVGPY
jgi:altronate dehydratase